MANTKQRGGSAAQRREQQRQQQQQRQQKQQRQQGNAGSRNRGPTIRNKRSRGQWLWIGGVLALIAVIIGVFIFLSYQNGQESQPADAGVVNTMTHIDATTWKVVGTGKVQNPYKVVSDSPPILKGPTGKPQVFYAGADYCPYCAAERWAMVAALSRFGTFANLHQIQSGESSIDTFTFYQSTFSSKYIDFVSVELYKNDRVTVLQQPTADQKKLISTYDGPPYFAQAGSIPFLDIGNQYVSSGASYDPQVLLDAGGNSLSWQDIAKGAADSTSQIGQNVLGTGNYMTAAICKITNQQPSAVCSDPLIQQIEQSLNKTSGTAAARVNGQTVFAGGFVAALRRLSF